MGLRIFTEPQQGASYDQLLAVARTTEECGFEGFFRSDHFLKMGSGTGMPAYTDAWTTLAGLARDTRSIRLGTLVTPATFRTVGTFPAVVTEVDHMSQGRVEVGLGAGWYQDEHVAYGIPFPGIGARYDLLEDQLAILHGVWTAPPGSLFERDGLTCNVRIQADPFRPAQKPHPPIILGGGGKGLLRVAAKHGDVLNVISEILDKLATFVDAGAQRVYLQVLDLSDLDHLRLVADEVLPHLPAALGAG